MTKVLEVKDRYAYYTVEPSGALVLRWGGAPSSVTRWTGAGDTRRLVSRQTRPHQHKGLWLTILQGTTPIRYAASKSSWQTALWYGQAWAR